MCISAGVIAAASLVTAAVGTVASIDNANYQSKMMEFQLLEQREQMGQQRDMERLRAMEAEQARLEEFSRMREANLAALAVKGTGQNMSYFQGIEKAEQQALRIDLSNIRVGLLGTENRIASEIRVNRLESSVNKSNAKSAKLAAGINFVNSALQTGQYYNDYNRPQANDGSKT